MADVPPASSHVYLKATGVRHQIRFMGGDLVQEDQLDWFRYMAEHMTDVLDAYSIHVFWDYRSPTDKSGRSPLLPRAPAYRSIGASAYWVRADGARGRSAA